jgi:hypothetical protein
MRLKPTRALASAAIYFDEHERCLHCVFDMHMKCAKNVSSKMSNV